MAARSVWSGSITFGLVTVPVKLTVAARSQDISFNQLDANTGSRIRQKRVAEATGLEVEFSDIVKAFEVEKGKYITITDEELAALKPKASQAIEIEDFVDIAEIDPIFFDKPYIVMPDKGGDKAYALLAEVMRAEGKVAIGRFVMRSKEHLAAIRPVNGVLYLETMRYADEVVAPEVAASDVAELGERELAMATQLVQALSAEFDPLKYTDGFRASVLELIAAKSEGKTVTAAAEPDTAPVGDLMAALEASLSAAKAPAKKKAKASA